jgi:hypothetical protein
LAWAGSAEPAVASTGTARSPDPITRSLAFTAVETFDAGEERYRRDRRRSHCAPPLFELRSRASARSTERGCTVIRTPRRSLSPTAPQSSTGPARGSSARTRRPRRSACVLHAAQASERALSDGPRARDEAYSLHPQELQDNRIRQPGVLRIGSVTSARTRRRGSCGDCRGAFRRCPGQRLGGVRGSRHGHECRVRGRPRDARTGSQQGLAQRSRSCSPEQGNLHLRRREVDA